MEMVYVCPCHSPSVSDIVRSRRVIVLQPIQVIYVILYSTLSQWRTTLNSCGW